MNRPSEGKKTFESKLKSTRSNDWACSLASLLASKSQIIRPRVVKLQTKKVKKSFDCLTWENVVVGMAAPILMCDNLIKFK